MSRAAYYWVGNNGFADGGNVMVESDIGSGGWLREHFPEKDWHRHPRTDGRTDWCDGTPSDCATKERPVMNPAWVCPICGEQDDA
jgi:hypothetical protein